MSSIKYTIIHDKGETAVSIDGRWENNLFIPAVLNLELLGNDARTEVTRIVKYFKDQLWILTSVRRSISGKLRAAGSHSRQIDKCAVDIAPLRSRHETPKAGDVSIRLADSLDILGEMAAEFTPSVGVVAEGDHFHVDPLMKPGIYSYPTYRKAYANDKENEKVTPGRFYVITRAGERVLSSLRDVLPSSAFARKLVL